jgi:hypothetical protein
VGRVRKDEALRFRQKFDRKISTSESGSTEPLGPFFLMSHKRMSPCLEISSRTAYLIKGTREKTRDLPGQFIKLIGKSKNLEARVSLPTCKFAHFSRQAPFSLHFHRSLCLPHYVYKISPGPDGCEPHSLGRSQRLLFFFIGN